MSVQVDSVAAKPSSVVAAATVKSVVLESTFAAEKKCLRRQTCTVRQLNLATVSLELWQRPSVKLQPSPQRQERTVLARHQGTGKNGISTSPGGRKEQY